MSAKAEVVWFEGYSRQKGRYRLVIRDGIVTKAEPAEEAYESSDVMVDAPEENLILPAGIRGIGERAFQECGMFSVRLPAGVTWIGEEAFRQCGLMKEVVLPEGVTAIGREAFLDCWDLETIAFPETLESIGVRAFWNCKGLEKIRIPGGVRELPCQAFGNCENLQEAELSPGLRYIRSEAFFWCRELRSMHLPEGLISVDEGALSYCDLSDMSIPASLEYIDEEALPRQGVIHAKGGKWVSALPKVNPGFDYHARKLQLRSTDLAINQLPKWLWRPFLRGYAHLCLEGFVPEGLSGMVNMLVLERVLLAMWDCEAVRTVLLDQRKLSLSIAQELVQQAGEYNMPDQAAVLLEYIHRNFSQEDLDRAREQKAQKLLEEQRGEEETGAGTGRQDAESSAGS